MVTKERVERGETVSDVITAATLGSANQVRASGSGHHPHNMLKPADVITVSVSAAPSARCMVTSGEGVFRYITVPCTPEDPPQWYLISERRCLSTGPRLYSQAYARLTVPKMLTRVC